MCEWDVTSVQVYILSCPNPSTSLYLLLSVCIHISSYNVHVTHVMYGCCTCVVFLGFYTCDWRVVPLASWVCTMRVYTYILIYICTFTCDWTNVSRSMYTCKLCMCTCACYLCCTNPFDNHMLYVDLCVYFTCTCLSLHLLAWEVKLSSIEGEGERGWRANQECERV